MHRDVVIGDSIRTKRDPKGSDPRQRRYEMTGHILKGGLVTGFIGLMLAFSQPALSEEMSHIRGLLDDSPGENVFRISIDKVEGDEPSPGQNHHIKPGKRSVEVSLVFNPKYGTGMDETANQTYSKSFTFDVKPGKTYTIAAKVDTHASKAAQEDGSFWTPIIYKEE